MCIIYSITIWSFATCMHLLLFSFSPWKLERYPKFNLFGLKLYCCRVCLLACIHSFKQMLEFLLISGAAAAHWNGTNATICLRFVHANTHTDKKSLSLTKMKTMLYPFYICKWQSISRFASVPYIFILYILSSFFFFFFPCNNATHKETQSKEDEEDDDDEKKKVHKRSMNRVVFACFVCIHTHK